VVATVIPWGDVASSAAGLALVGVIYLARRVAQLGERVAYMEGQLEGEHHREGDGDNDRAPPD
jgi:hypothetical protein